MKFIADVMLGRLAKWMRLLGFDVHYDRTISDNEIIRISLEQERIILTRDTRLAERPLAANHLFIENDNTKEQLRQILTSFHIEKVPGPLTRCSVCNTPLFPLAKQEVKDDVPHHVYQKNTIFLRCDRCGKIYWRGSHVKRMEIMKK